MTRLISDYAILKFRLTATTALIVGALLADSASAKGIPESCKPSTIMTKLFTKPAIEKRIGKAPEWNLSPELTEELKKYWDNPDLSLEQKMRHTYERAFEERTKKLNPVSRVGVKLAARNILDRSGWYQKSIGKWIGSFSGSHYNPISNSIFLSSTKGGRLSDFVVAFHEAQHAIDRNSNVGALLGQAAMIKEFSLLVPTPIGAATRYSLESKAIGAQWELMQQIPEAQRKVIREAIVNEANVAYVLKNMDEEWAKSWLKKRNARQMYSMEELEEIDSMQALFKSVGEQLDSHDKIAVKTIDFAHLPKEEFIAKMRDFHGYSVKNIMKGHYSFDGVRKTLAWFSAGSAVWVAKGIYDQKPEDVKNAIKRISYADMRLYLTLIANAVYDDDVKPKKKKKNRALRDMEKDLDRELKEMANQPDSATLENPATEKKKD
jgi:hypothetical protein